MLSDEEALRAELISELVAEFVLPVGGAHVDQGAVEQLMNYMVESLNIKDVATVRALGSETFVESLRDQDKDCKGLALRMVRARAEYFCGEKPAMKPLALTSARVPLTAHKLAAKGFSHPSTRTRCGDQFGCMGTHLCPPG